jgi:hypothetical protein
MRLLLLPRMRGEECGMVLVLVLVLLLLLPLLVVLDDDVQ